MPLSVYRGNTPVLCETDYVRVHFQFPCHLGHHILSSTVDPVCAASSCVQKSVWLSMHGTCKLCTDSCQCTGLVSCADSCQCTGLVSCADSCQCMGLLSCTQTAVNARDFKAAHRQLSMHGTCKLCRQTAVNAWDFKAAHRQLSMHGTFKLHTDSYQCMGLLSCTQATFKLHTQLSMHETLKLRTKCCQCMRLHRGAV